MKHLAEFVVFVAGASALCVATLGIAVLIVAVADWVNGLLNQHATPAPPAHPRQRGAAGGRW